jgi:hypothetical protein
MSDIKRCIFCGVPTTTVLQHHYAPRKAGKRGNADLFP